MYFIVECITYKWNVENNVKMYAVKIDNSYIHICDVKHLYHNEKNQHICNIHVTSENYIQSCANKYYNLPYILSNFYHW